MGKITVKRFFNKKLKPIDIENIKEKAYPLYYTITYNRKVQNVKSLCGAVMTEKAFNHLEQTGKELEKEIIYPFDLEKDLENYDLYSNEVYDVRVKVTKELFFIQKALEILIEKEKKENIFDKKFIPRLKNYFVSTSKALYNIGWFFYRYDATKDRESTKIKVEKHSKLFSDGEAGQMLGLTMYNLFNRNRNIIDTLNMLEIIANVDLSKYIYEDTLKLWQVIHTIELTHPESILLEFILNFDVEKYYTTNLEFGYNLTKNEVRYISNDLKDKVLHAIINNV